MWLWATVISEADGLTIGLAFALCVVAIAWGEARVHIAALREWKREAQAEITALKGTTAALSGRADLQDQRMNHILELLKEMREDVKSLLRIRDAA